MVYEELVKRLREATGWKNASEHYSLMKEAADAIEKLAAAIAQSYARDCITEDEVRYCPYCGTRMDKDNNGKSES